MPPARHVAPNRVGERFEALIGIADKQMTTPKSELGYSGTPLWRKLGIAPGMRLLVHGAPRPYADIVAPLPDAISISDAPDGAIDLAHAFVTQKEELHAVLVTLRPVLRPEVPVWISWPKRTSRVPTDVTEDVIRTVALPMGYVDVKVCAVDSVWSGLKLVVRVANR